MAKKIEINTGEKFNRLTFIKEVEPYISNNKPTRVGQFRCDCGTIKNIIIRDVRLGIVKSCTCLHRENSTKRKPLLKHNHTSKRKPTITYNSWNSMKQRCSNPNGNRWELYGGRGITVCDRWRNSFENFLEDMGERPFGTSIDRINVNGNYEPSNCRWATPSEQRYNQTRNVIING